MPLIDLNFDEPEEEVGAGAPVIDLAFEGEEHLSEPRPRGVDGDMYADPYSNIEKMGERLSQRWSKTKAGLGAMAANQEVPETYTDMTEGVAPPIDGDWKDWALYTPHGAMLNQVSSMVMSGVVDVGDMVRRGDLREDLRTANKIVREEADRTLGAEYMQYTGNVGQKFGWDVAEATVNMGGAVAVGWATRNPGLALAVIAGEVGGTAYTDYLAKTGSHDRAMAAAKFHTYAEIIPETIPVLAILRKTGAGDGMRRFLEGTVGEGAQELITSILTQTYDAKELENMTLKEAILNIDWGDAMYESAIGLFVGGILSTPGTASDYIQYKAEAEGKPPPAGPAPPDFDVKSVEENQGAIDQALAETPDDPAGDFEPGEAGPEIEIEGGSIAGEPVLTEAEQQAQDLREQLEAADAEETVKTPEDLANDEWVAEQLRAQGYGEEEIQAAIVANKPQTKQDMGWVAPVEEGESEGGPTAPINPDGSLTPIDGKILPDPRDAKGDAWVAPEDVEPSSTPAPMTPVPEQKQPDDERGGMLSEPAELPPAEPWGPVEETPTDGLESYRDKARSDFEKHGVSDRDRMTKVEALGKNVSKEAADAYDSTYADLVEKAVAERVASQTDEITRDELIATTENVETTGEAVQVSEEYRTARPEFKDLVLSFKPGDDRHGTEMEHYYGEIGGTEDADAMPIDVMLNKDYKTEPWLSSIFVINQMDEKTGEFKQHKVMAGFSEMEPAETAFMNQWGEDSWDSTYELTPEEFQEWRDSGDHQNAFEPYERKATGEIGGMDMAARTDKGRIISDPEVSIHAQLLTTENQEILQPDKFEFGYTDKEGNFYTREEAQAKMEAPDEEVSDTETEGVGKSGKNVGEVSASDAAAVSPDDFDAMLEDTESGAMTREEYEAQTGEAPEVSDQLDAEEQAAQAAADRSEDARVRGVEQTKKRQQVNETDDLITFLRKMGGINVDNQSDITSKQMEGLDDEKRVGLFNLAQHGDQGMQVDEAAAAAMEAGYIDTHDIKALADKIDDARLRPVYNSAGFEADMKRQDEAEYDRQQLNNEEYQQTLNDDADDMAAYMIEISGGPRYSAEDIPELIGLAADVDYGAVQDVTFDNTLSEDEVRTKLQAIIDGELKSGEVAADTAGEGAKAASTSTPAVPAGSPQTTTETQGKTADSGSSRIRGIPISPRMEEAIGLVGREKFLKQLKKRGNRLGAQKGTRHLQNIADGLAAQIISENWSGAAPEINDNGHINRDNAEWMNYEGLKKDRTQTNLSVIQISENLWSYGQSIMGKNAGLAHGISLYAIADSKIEAQEANLRTAENFWKGEARDKNDSVSSKASRAEATRALKWVHEQMDSLGITQAAASGKNIDEMSKQELEIELGYDSTMQDEDYLRKLVKRKRAEKAPELTVDAKGQTDPFAPDAGQQQAIEGKKGENAMSDAQKKVAQKMGTGIDTPANAQSADDIFADEQTDIFADQVGNEHEQIKAHKEKFYEEQNRVKPESEKKTVVLIACCATKSPKAGPAREMYQSQLFKSSLAYAESLNPDDIFVLSAKHGLVGIDEVVEPYDTSMKDKGVQDRKVWATRAVLNLRTLYPDLAEKFVILAGKDYRENIVSEIGGYRNATIETPLEGLGIGEQLAELKRLNAEPVERRDLVENATAEDYPIGGEWYYGGYKAKVTGFQTPEQTGGRPLVELEYIEGPEKGKAQTAPGHLKELQDVLVEPFDINTTNGTVRVTASWAMDPDSYMEIYKDDDRVGALMSVAVHGPDYRNDYVRYRSSAGVPVTADTREQMLDPAWIKETATQIAASSLKDHFDGKPTRITGRAPDTLTEVLERSREIPKDKPGRLPLGKVSITVEGEGKKVTHKAKWWVDAIDKRLEAVNKLRTCR